MTIGNQYALSINKAKNYVQSVAWGDTALAQAVQSLNDRPDIDAANRKVLDIIFAGKPVLAGMAIAGEVIPNMTPATFLHAGPPVVWENMSGPMRGAIMGAAILEGLATDLAEAEAKASSGAFTFSPCNDNHSVGSMVGVTSYSMPVFVIENLTYGNRAFSLIMDDDLSFGANSPHVIKHQQWLRNTFYPIVQDAIGKLSEPIYLKPMLAAGMLQGDEGHNRLRASGLLLLESLLPGLLAVDASKDNILAVFQKLKDHFFFLPMSMGMAKACLAPAEGVSGSTVVTAISRNGFEVGIKVSGLPGQWFTGPAGQLHGMLLPGITEQDCCLDMGDSAITETFGIGGSCMANAPAITQIVGGNVHNLFAHTHNMYNITISESPDFLLPALNFRGAPTGIDIRRVVALSESPVINSGIAHRDAGVGIVGCGVSRPPTQCFAKALSAFITADAKS